MGNIVVAVVCVLCAAAVYVAGRKLDAWLVRRARRNRESVVQIGDLWETTRRRDGLVTCEVVAPNFSREAGPDSWEMRTIPPPGVRSRTLYMHRPERREWTLVMRAGLPTRGA